MNLKNEWDFLFNYETECGCCAVVLLLQHAENAINLAVAEIYFIMAFALSLKVDEATLLIIEGIWQAQINIYMERRIIESHLIFHKLHIEMRIDFWDFAVVIVKIKMDLIS